MRSISGVASLLFDTTYKASPLSTRTLVPLFFLRPLFSTSMDFLPGTNRETIAQTHRRLLKRGNVGQATVGAFFLFFFCSVLSTVDGSGHVAGQKRVVSDGQRH